MGQYSAKQKQQLDKIQNEAVRIVTRCSKLVSLDDVQKESLLIADTNTESLCFIKCVMAWYLLL